MKREPHLLLTCEHGGCRVPTAYRGLFRGQRSVLSSHRGYDLGALDLAGLLARRLDVPLVASTVTRLLVELNRSRGHRRLFSEFTTRLDRAAKEAILREFYEPHRAEVERRIAKIISHGHAALHVGIHSFTPVLRGNVRTADVGLLYDPRRPLERRWARRWRDALRLRRPDLRVRRNYPYLGRSDGLTTALRRQFGPPHYAGVELEVNQRWPKSGGRAWQQLQRDLCDSLRDAMAI